MSPWPWVSPASCASVAPAWPTVTCTGLSSLRSASSRTPSSTVRSCTAPGIGRAFSTMEGSSTSAALIISSSCAGSASNPARSRRRCWSRRTSTRRWWWHRRTPMASDGWWRTWRRQARWLRPESCERGCGRVCLTTWCRQRSSASPHCRSPRAARSIVPLFRRPTGTTTRPREHRLRVLSSRSRWHACGRIPWGSTKPWVFTRTSSMSGGIRCSPPASSRTWIARSASSCRSPRSSTEPGRSQGWRP